MSFLKSVGKFAVDVGKHAGKHVMLVGEYTKLDDDELLNIVKSWRSSIEEVRAAKTVLKSRGHSV